MSIFEILSQIVPGSGALAACVALWRQMIAERSKCDERISKLENQISECQENARREIANWIDRWTKEVRLGVTLAATPQEAKSPPPVSLPPPPWKEVQDEVAKLRDAIQTDAIKGLCHDYLKDPPK